LAAFVGSDRRVSNNEGGWIVIAEVGEGGHGLKMGIHFPQEDVPGDAVECVREVYFKADEIRIFPAAIDPSPD
jgi:hypothetical protein